MINLWKTGRENLEERKEKERKRENSRTYNESENGQKMQRINLVNTD